MWEIIIAIVGVVASVFVAYHVAHKATRAEEEKGKAMLQNFAQRYFISMLNSFDHTTNQLKTDRLTKRQYIAELDAILNDFGTLSSNPFYIRFLTKTPFAAKCLVQARRERIEHDETESFALNIGTAKGFALMYRESRKGLKEKQLIEPIIEWVEKLNVEQGAGGNWLPPAH